MEISDERISVEVEYDYEEFKRIYFDSSNKTPIFAGILNNPSYILIIVTISLVGLYFYGRFSIPLFLTALVFINILLAFIARTAVFAFRKWFELWAKHYYKSEDEHFTLHKKFVFENDGIEVTFGGTVKKINWAKIVKATENDAGLLIYYDRYLKEYIPKRVFDVYEELSRLKSFIRDRIGDRAEF
jgi:hypothetical protein